VWDWFSDDLYTRLEPGASIILIQTRWHEDDLAGRLLGGMEDGGDHWEVISLPALAEEPITTTETQRHRVENNVQAQSNDPLSKTSAPTEHDEKLSHRSSLCLRASVVDVLGRVPGEALCPERFNTETLERIRRQLGSYSFSALYQQRPVPPEGGLFKRKWFRIVDQAPKNLHWKRGYDLAISKKTSADYTASVRCAFDTDGTLYIADGFRARIEYPEQRRYVMMRMAAEPGTEHGIEASLHGQAIVQDLRREAYLRGRAFRAVHVAADKFTRALAWANLAEEGKVVLVRGPWNDAFIDEVASFPTGRHDDQVDAVSLAVQMLNRGKRTIFGF
jgi:predicted phage terminase large subunit-like protein